MAELHTIATPIGPVTGLTHHASPTTTVETLVFKGIPYAAADRFGAPEPVTNLVRQATRSSQSEPLRGGFDATQYRAQCPQNPGTLERLLGSTSLEMHEECLHLNVFTPDHRGRPRPVVVWIHGGAFVNGSGSMPWYHGSQLAALGDVVVVTCNYRLGAFGFLGEQDLGLADQIAVLQWVQRNVEAFGGNPDQVTVFGESAGGTSVLSLIAATRSTDLAHRFWAMSPSIPQLRSLERSREAASQFHGIAPSDPTGLTTTELLSVQAELEADRSGALTAFSPTAGGAVLPGPHPADALAVIADDPRPLVIGTTRDEMHLFTAFDPASAALTEDQVLEQFDRRFGSNGSAALTTYRQHRPGASNAQVLSAMTTDETFRVTARRLAENKTAGPVWSYWFCQSSTAFDGVLGACHGLDIPYVFANLDRPGVPMFIGEHHQHHAVATEFSGRFLRFATNGDPGWETYDAQNRATFQIGGVHDEVSDAPVSQILHDPEPEIRELWDRAG
jgi:para-nitrobenzyl esterase